MRIVFMGTPEFAVPALESLVHAGYEIAAVYTQPDRAAGRGKAPAAPAVKAAALAHGLTVHQPEGLKGEVERIAGLAPQAIVLAAYAEYLPTSILNVPTHGCLNIHPSLLPRHRGPSPVAAAILAADEVAGVSIMRMVKAMDCGPLLAQESTPVLPEDTTGTLSARLAQVGARLLLQALPSWMEGRLEARPQDESRATYSQMMSKADGEMDWRLPAVELWRRVRALQPWPGCYTRWKGKLLKIIEAAPAPEDSGEEVGRVVQVDLERGACLGVQTGAGVLELVRVQLEGKSVLTCADFERGYRDFPGSRLGNQS